MLQNSILFQKLGIWIHCSCRVSDPGGYNTDSLRKRMIASVISGLRTYFSSPQFFDDYWVHVSHAKSIMASHLTDSLPIIRT